MVLHVLMMERESKGHRRQQQKLKNLHSQSYSDVVHRTVYPGQQKSRVVCTNVYSFSRQIDE